MSAPHPDIANMPGYNASVESFREQEFPMLRDAVYLDHAGTTLYSKSLVDRFAKDMTSSLLGNPHSASPSSQLSTSRIEDIRLRVLQLFGADPTQFDLVFVANATAAIKLVAEAFRALPGGFDYGYHQASHTSVVGVREEARNSLCLDSAAVAGWIAGRNPFDQTSPRAANTLFAYPAQSNMDGRRFPLYWPGQLRAEESDEAPSRLFTLLDAAAFVSTSPLDLSTPESAPDFTAVSFSKIFGFPDLGGLIVKRTAEAVFDSRRYFGGGTVDMVVCIKEQWHAPKSQYLHERLEDGTLPIHSILALDAALDTHPRLFGSMVSVAAHTAVLARRLYEGLDSLRHWNGTPVCSIYSPHPASHDEDVGTGPVVAFNICNSLGAWVSLTEFEKLATLKLFHVRTGGLCNPGGIARALGLEPWETKRNFSSGLRCGSENDIMAGKPTGVIRASLGAMSTLSDIDSFIAFIDDFYRDATDPRQPARPTKSSSPPLSGPNLHVASICVYPIKSCAAFSIPKGQSWEVRPEGLAWDREWCLIHRGTGQALDQKRHPKMALIRPTLDFEQGRLQVSYAGEMPPGLPMEVFIPLSENPGMFQSGAALWSRSSRVCGDEILAQAYASEETNAFFSEVLGVPCVLARFPPGGQGKSMRHSKAHLQKHQELRGRGHSSVPEQQRFPPPPSPPDSDSENHSRRILLSNESPILAIHLASLRALNEEIRKRGGEGVAPAVFRANVMLDSAGPHSESARYAEDTWSSLRIGQQRFKMLGSCRRCHMVCINQETGLKSEEPFVTLSKTRRFDGKVFFGTHMGHDPPSQGSLTREAQFPTIRVGDAVEVDV